MSNYSYYLFDQDKIGAVNCLQVASLKIYDDEFYELKRSCMEKFEPWNNSSAYLKMGLSLFFI